LLQWNWRRRYACWINWTHRSVQSHIQSSLVQSHVQSSHFQSLLSLPCLCYKQSHFIYTLIHSFLPFRTFSVPYFTRRLHCAARRLRPCYALRKRRK
jgi:hypothetical protein